MSFDFIKYRHLMDKGTRVYFVGVGGISMSGLAELALSRGQIVAGSDMSPNRRCRDIEQKGVRIFAGHAPEHLTEFKPDVLVYTAAVSSSNPELVYARAHGIPCIERSDWLGLLNREFRQVINVAGTNGKSTTSSMTSLICLDAGLNPTVHIGAEIDRFRSTVHVGGTELMISEACEFHLSFLSFRSTIASVLNLGHDHIDCFPTMQDVIEAFARFVSLLEDGSFLVLPAFDPYIPALLEAAEKQSPGLLSRIHVKTFGYKGDQLLGRAPDLMADHLRFDGGLPVFDVYWEGRFISEFILVIPGKFNVDNALAAILMAHLAGADFETARQTLQSFKGAEGRFTLCGHYHGATVIADYAHHPDSVKLTLDAAEALPHKRLFACFQPITYSRAKGLFQGYVEALKDRDHPILVEVFDDREEDRSFSSSHIADAIRAEGGRADFFPSAEALEEYMRSELQEGDLLILMGQDIRRVGDRLCRRKDHYGARASLADELCDTKSKQ